MRAPSSLALLACLTLACGAPAGLDAPAGIDRMGVLVATGERVIVPGVNALAERTTALSSSLTALCAGPERARVERAREAWADAYLAFERTAPYDFGPARDRNLALELGFWPARTESIEAHVASSDVISDAWIDRLGASGEGLFSIEYLLFEPADAEVIAQRLVTDPRRCVYLEALGRHAARTAGALRSAWQGPDGHLALLASASSPGNLTYRSLLTAESIVMSHLLESIGSIRRGRLERAFGELDEHTPQPLAIRSRWAHRSVEGMVATLDGVRALWTADGATDASLEALVRHRRPDLADRIAVELAVARQAVVAIPEPLTEYARRSDRAGGERAIAALRTLEVSFRVEVVGLLGVSLLPLDLDGD